MKLLFAIVQDEDAKNLTRALVQHEISVTRIASSGGFLRGGNTTLMIGVEKDRLEDALEIIKNKSSQRKSITTMSPGISQYVDSAPMTIEVTVGGATVFIVDVEQFYKF